MKSSLTVATLIVAATALAAQSQSPVRAGRWEVTMQMQIPNVPVQMPEMKSTQCITPAQLDDPASTLPRRPESGRGNSKQNCKVSDYKVSGNTVTWNMSCSASEAMKSSGEMTYNDDSYAGMTKMTSSQGEMTMKISGKRLGDCTQ